MKTALATLFGSKKFTTMIVGLAIALGARFGLMLEPELVAATLGVVAVLIGAQGAADFGKEAVKEQALSACGPLPVTPPEAREPERGSVELLALVAGMSLVVGVVGCTWLATQGKSMRPSIVDCTTSAAKHLSTQFGPVVDALLVNATGGDGKLDWSPVKAATKSFAVDAGGCVLAGVIARALAPKPVDPAAPQASPLEVDPADLRAGFEAIRGELYGGARFQLETGTL